LFASHTYRFWARALRIVLKHLWRLINANDATWVGDTLGNRVHHAGINELLLEAILAVKVIVDRRFSLLLGAFGVLGLFAL